MINSPLLTTDPDHPDFGLIQQIIQFMDGNGDVADPNDPHFHRLLAVADEHSMVRTAALTIQQLSGIGLLNPKSEDEAFIALVSFWVGAFVLGYLFADAGGGVKDHKKEPELSEIHVRTRTPEAYRLVNTENGETFAWNEEKKEWDRVAEANPERS